MQFPQHPGQLEQGAAVLPGSRYGCRVERVEVRGNEQRSLGQVQMGPIKREAQAIALFFPLQHPVDQAVGAQAGERSSSLLLGAIVYALAKEVD